MGSLVRCAGCSVRCDTRPISVYWRWMRADGVWKHYYGRYCTGCYAAKVLPLDVSYAGAENLTCPACGISTEDDYDGIYTTSFPRKGPQLDTESPFCDKCAVDIRLWIQAHARDTDNDVGAPGPQRESPSGDQVLRALGRTARAG